MKKILTLTLSVAALAMLVACHNSNDLPEKPKELALNQNTIEGKCEVGAQVVISIEGNPTTGYEWNLADYDTSIMTFGGSSYANRILDLKTGEGGTYKFFFRTKNIGKTKATFNYARPWEAAKGAKPLDTETFEIEVQSREDFNK